MKRPACSAPCTSSKPYRSVWKASEGVRPPRWPSRYISRAGPQEDRFVSSDPVIDFALHQVQVAGPVVPLTLKEYRLLEVLAGHAGAVVPNDLLLSPVWQSDWIASAGYIADHRRPPDWTALAAIVLVTASPGRGGLSTHATAHVNLGHASDGVIHRPFTPHFREVHLPSPTRSPASTGTFTVVG